MTTRNRPARRLRNPFPSTPLLNRLERLMRRTVGVIIFLIPSLGAQAWIPTDWNYMQWPYVYSHGESCWYYFNQTDEQYYVDLTSNEWSKLGSKDPLDSGWVYFQYPYVYSFSRGGWFYTDVSSTLWCINLSTALWSLLGESDGFDRDFCEGAFWEYGWGYKSSYSASGSSSSSSYSSTFRVTLGQPMTAGSMTFYEMLISGTTDAGDNRNMRPRGAYLADSDGRIFTLSSDGTTMKTLFDLQTGFWPGGGFFTDFPNTTLFMATLGTISNDYMEEQAYFVRESESTSQCQNFPGIGLVCGGDYDENMDEREYYIEGLGPVGYYAYFSVSDMSGSGGGWSASNTTHIGLTACSLRGDTVDYTLEIEPNNQIAEATQITLPAKVGGGSVSETYLGGTTAVSVGTSSVNEAEPNDSPFLPQTVDIPSLITADALNGDAFTSVSVSPSPSVPNYTATFEDWYKVTLGTNETLNVSLDFSGTGADLDMYLFSLENESSVITHANSVDDNVESNVYREEIIKFLSSGTYFLAVDAFATSHGRADYTLGVSIGDDLVDICDWFSFSLASQTEVTITVTGGPSFVLMDSTGTNTLNNGGAAGTSMTLSSGSYLIGVSENGPYTLEVTSP